MNGGEQGSRIGRAWEETAAAPELRVLVEDARRELTKGTPEDAI